MTQQEENAMKIMKSYQKLRDLLLRIDFNKLNERMGYVVSDRLDDVREDLESKLRAVNMLKS